MSSATGLPGQHERLDQAQVDGNVEVLANQILVGGVIEAATDECTHRFVNRLGELDIPPVQAVFRPVGTHSWGLLAGRPAPVVADDRAALNR